MNIDNRNLYVPLCMWVCAYCNLHEIMFYVFFCNFPISSNSRSWKSFPTGTYRTTLFFLMSLECSVAWTLVWILFGCFSKEQNSRGLNKVGGTFFMWQFQQVVRLGQAARLHDLIQVPGLLLFCCSAFSQYVVPMCVAEASWPPSDRGSPGPEKKKEEMEDKHIPFKGMIRKMHISLCSRLLGCFCPSGFVLSFKGGRET